MLKVDRRGGWRLYYHPQKEFNPLEAVQLRTTIWGGLWRWTRFSFFRWYSMVCLAKWKQHSPSHTPGPALEESQESSVHGAIGRDEDRLFYMPLRFVIGKMIT